MPRPAHTLVTYSGIFGTVAAPLEEWQFSLRVGPTVFASQAERAAAALTCKQGWDQYCAGSVQSIARLQSVRVAQVDGLGKVSKTDGGAYNQADHNEDSPGVGAGDSLPLQIALAVSLRTARSGPEGKGRFYLPAPAVALGADRRVTAERAGTIAANMKAFVEHVDGAFTQFGVPGGNVVVASSKGFLSVVTGVRVGRVLDTQRRRRGDMQEGYADATVVQ